MTPKKIFRLRPDIREKVMIDYPVTKKEKKCSSEQSKREQLRFERAKRYYSEAENIYETK